MRWVLGFHIKQDKCGNLVGVVRVAIRWESYRSLAQGVDPNTNWPCYPRWSTQGKDVMHIRMVLSPRDGSQHVGRYDDTHLEAVTPFTLAFSLGCFLWSLDFTFVPFCCLLFRLSGYKSHKIRSCGNSPWLWLI